MSDLFRVEGLSKSFGGLAVSRNISLSLPAGERLALIGPKIDGQGTGAQVGAGAAAKLTFTVEPSLWLEGALRQVWRFIQENPWAVALVALVVALVVLRLLRRRFSFSVARKA